MLEALPVELFHEIASYLTFPDKKALSIVSRRCHFMTGQFECPNQLAWFIHLCRSPVKFQGPLFENPMAFRGLTSSVYAHLVLRYRGTIAVKVDMEELMSSYFPYKTFPESMLIHYYMTVAQGFAKSVIEISDAAGLGNASLTPRCYFGRIENETSYVLEWLEHQKPTEIHCCKAVPCPGYSGNNIWRRRA